MTSQERNLGRLAALVLAMLGLAADGQRALPPQPTVAPPLTAALSNPAPPPPEALLRPGEAVTLRILQVVPADGLSPGERLLNGRNPILPGDRFLAEVIEPPCELPALVGGSVTKVVRPGWFGRPGYVNLQLAQFIQTVDGKGRGAPWQVSTDDRQVAARMGRALLSSLLAVDGAIVASSIGAQLAPAHLNGVWTSAGAAAGLLLGLGYSSFQRGSEASLEPGDTFHLVVGSMVYRPVSKEWQTILYPASATASRKGKGK